MRIKYSIFQDDLIANHEASAGTIALIRLYDRVMTPVFVRRDYQTISKSFKEPVAQETQREEPKAPELGRQVGVRQKSRIGDRPDLRRPQSETSE